MSTTVEGTHFVLGIRCIDAIRELPAVLFSLCKLRELTPQAEEDLAKETKRRCEATAFGLNEGKDTVQIAWSVNEALYLRSLLMLVDGIAWENNDMHLALLRANLCLACDITHRVLLTRAGALSGFCANVVNQANGRPIL